MFALIKLLWKLIGDCDIGRMVSVDLMNDATGAERLAAGYGSTRSGPLIIGAGRDGRSEKFILGEGEDGRRHLVRNGLKRYLGKN